MHRCDIFCIPEIRIRNSSRLLPAKKKWFKGRNKGGEPQRKLVKLIFIGKLKSFIGWAQKIWPLLSFHGNERKFWLTFGPLVSFGFQINQSVCLICLHKASVTLFWRRKLSPKPQWWSRSILSSRPWFYSFEGAVYVQLSVSTKWEMWDEN